ncbi:hypothetical protein JIR001_21650 [Polycladomyces abyssicola]|uniref:2Fe-2S ferredoxin-type domain-containing protein n=1 Tax=Polycladomyces abyssicola TaxID=1125966 RepID=A0A8D5ZNW8_9BACL|nr:2Fe-2S iron-sulfur cluster-binding protein [Polycladomyces abyssicola]BCU82382.1 hypothetical protein JIR001_21650 [Polycladomyces abyssicola]
MPKVIVEEGGDTHQFEVEEGANLLLEATLRSVPVPFYCTTGRCGTCRVKVEDGEDHLNAIGELERYRLGDEETVSGMRLACQVYIYGDVKVRVPASS